ncbi:MAG: hypothetical protein QXJ06_05330 [Candidatus Aenigmatarchaeota archaeon]
MSNSRLDNRNDIRAGNQMQNKSLNQLVNDFKNNLDEVYNNYKRNDYTQMDKLIEDICTNGDPSINKFHEYLTMIRKIRDLKSRGNQEWKKEVYKVAIKLKYIAVKNTNLRNPQKAKYLPAAVAEFLVNKCDDKEILDTIQFLEIFFAKNLISAKMQKGQMFSDEESH